MGNLCRNELTLEGDAEYLEELQKQMVNAPMNGEADGWRDVVISLLYDESFEYDSSSVPRYPFGTTYEFDRTDDSASLTLTFETKWGPEEDLAEEMARWLPLSRVYLLAEGEMDDYGVRRCEWIDGVATLDRRSENVWSLYDGQLIYWTDEEDVEPYFTLDDEEITIEQGAKLLAMGDEDLSFVFANPTKAWSVVLALLGLDDFPQRTTLIEYLDEVPRELLLEALGSTEDDFDGIPNSWLVKLLSGQKA